MLVATWILAGATVGLLLTSLVVVITWRENRRREREGQIEARVLESARREFSAKDEVGNLKSNLVSGAVVAGIVVALAVAARLSGATEKQ